MASIDRRKLDGVAHEEHRLYTYLIDAHNIMIAFRGFEFDGEPSEISYSVC